MCFHWIQVNSFHFSVAKNHSEENRKLDFSKFRSLCFRFGFYRSFWWAIHTNCVFCTQLNDCSISWSKYFGLFVFSWSKSSILDVVQCIGDGTKRSTTLNPFHSGGKFKKKKHLLVHEKSLPLIQSIHSDSNESQRIRSAKIELRIDFFSRHCETLHTTVK